VEDPRPAVTSDDIAARPREAARELALRTLARRDLSQRSLERWLERAGVTPEVSAATVAELVEERLVDDRRLARARSASLADRGLGDAAIDARLAAEGIERELRREALGELAPEEDRAATLAGRLAGRGPRRVAATLSRRGFAPGAVETALARLDGDSYAELR
jgi:SOS response regulatory protein OraA/RecX